MKDKSYIIQSYSSSSKIILNKKFKKDKIATESINALSWSNMWIENVFKFS